MKKQVLIISCLAILMALAFIALPSTSVKAIPIPEHGAISIVFDDGRTSQYAAYQLMATRGIHGTFYINPDNVDLYPELIMSWTQIQAIQAAGNEIGSHGKTHTVLTNNLTAAQLIEELNGSKTALQSHGLTVNNFAYPGGATNATVESYVQQYYRSGRTYVSSIFLQGFPIWTSNPNYYSIGGIAGETGDSTALTRLKAIVDDMYANNTWGAIVFHDVIPGANSTDYAISTADFTAFLDYIVSKGVTTLTMNQALNVGHTKTLTMSTNYAGAGATVSPANGEYESDTDITITANSPANSSTTRYVFLGWTGTGSGSYTGTDVTHTITMMSDITEVAAWKVQYYLTVTSAFGSPSPASGWYDNGTIISAYVASPFSNSSGIRYLCTGWSGTGSVPSSGSSSAVTFTISAPSTLTWNWKTQYLLTVSSAHGTVGNQGWYDAGTSVSATISPTTVTGTTGTRYVFTRWSGDASGSTSTSNAILMNGPKTATANWQTQYNLTFTQSGVGSDFSGTMVTVNGTGYGRVGFSVWANASDVYTFNYATELVVGANSKQYVLTGVSGNSSALKLTVAGPTTVTGAYKTQYYLDVISAYGSPSPSSGWYDSGTIINEVISTTATGSDGGTRYLTGWSGTGSVPASGSVSVFSFTIEAPSTLTWNWTSNWMEAYGTTLIIGIGVSAAAAVLLGGLYFFRRRK